MKEILLKGEGICKVFDRGGNSVQVLNQVDIEIYEGDFTVIMGASGAGKSTLLYALSGMDGISGGKCSIRERRSVGTVKIPWPGFGQRSLGLYFSRPTW